jgi:DNA-binding response OmpR family regulator
VTEKKILIVEDMASTGLLISLILREDGYEVIGPAATTVIAADLIASDAPDAALLDVTLNFESSFPVAELLIALGTPFAFMTGHEPDELPSHLHDVPCLRKPIGSDDLLATVGNLIRTYT